jgi:predicted DNA binding CopG/RHH family protein
MKKEIENRIIELGGKCSFQGKSLQDDLMSISFEKTFLPHDFCDLLSDEQYEELRVKGALSISEPELLEYMRIEYEPFLYTPFKKGTEDYDDENDVLKQYEDYAKSIIGDDIQEFLVVGYTDAERYIVSLADKNPANPKVYEINMDLPFSENCLFDKGTLEEYFNSFVSANEYPRAIEKLVRKEPKVKITITLNSGSIDFFKKHAKKNNVKYQTMINEVLGKYVKRYNGIKAV